MERSLSSGALTSPQIGFSVENAAENYVASRKSRRCHQTSAFASSAWQFWHPQYEGDKNYKVDTTTGELVSNRPTVQITALYSGRAVQPPQRQPSPQIKQVHTTINGYVKKGAAAPSIDEQPLKA